MFRSCTHANSCYGLCENSTKIYYCFVQPFLEKIAKYNFSITVKMVTYSNVFFVIKYQLLQFGLKQGLKNETFQV